MKNQLGSPHLPHLSPNPREVRCQPREIRRGRGSRGVKILKVTMTKFLLLEKLKIEFKFGYRKIKEVIFPVCLSFQCDTCVLYTMRFSLIEEGIKLQRILVWVILFLFFLFQKPLQALSLFSEECYCQQSGKQAQA